MNGMDFRHVCELVQEGREEFVSHPGTHEEGRVLRCENDRLIVDVLDGHQRQWDFKECIEIGLQPDYFRFG